MADNTRLNQGSGGNLLATDEVTINSTSVHAQRVKVGHGADGSYSDCSASAPLPVDTAGGATVKYLAINIAASADLVAAVTGSKIRVLSLVLSGNNAATTATFQSGASTALTGVLPIPTAVMPLVLPYNPTGWFETVSGEKLNIVVAGAGTEVDGMLSYVEV